MIACSPLAVNKHPSRFRAQVALCIPRGIHVLDMVGSENDGKSGENDEKESSEPASRPMAPFRALVLRKLWHPWVECCSSCHLGWWCWRRPCCAPRVHHRTNAGSTCWSSIHGVVLMRDVGNVVEGMLDGELCPESRVLVL